MYLHDVQFIKIKDDYMLLGLIEDDQSIPDNSLLYDKLKYLLKWTTLHVGERTLFKLDTIDDFIEGVIDRAGSLYYSGTEQYPSKDDVAYAYKDEGNGREREPDLAYLEWVTNEHNTGIAKAITHIKDYLQYAQPLEFFTMRAISAAIRMIDKDTLRAHEHIPEQANVLEVRTTESIEAAYVVAELQNQSILLDLEVTKRAWPRQKTQHANPFNEGKSCFLLKRYIPGENGYYVSMLDWGGVCSTKDKGKAIRFNIQDEKEQFEALNKELLAHWRVGFEIVPLTKMIPADSYYVLQSNRPCYFVKKSKKRVWHSIDLQYAKQFKTYEIADKYLKSCMPLYTNFNFRVVNIQDTAYF